MFESKSEAIRVRLDEAGHLAYLGEVEAKNLLHERGLSRLVLSPEWAESAYAFDTEIFGEDAWPLSGWREQISWPTSLFLAYVKEGSKEIRALGAVSLGIEADILTIGVKKSLRGTSLGSLLLRDLLTGAFESGAREAYLEVRAKDTNVQSFYLSHGWEEVGFRPAYYSDDDARIMHLTFAHSKLRG